MSFSIIGNLNAKVGSQEIPGVTGKFGLGVQNKAGQRLPRVLPRECTSHSKHCLPTTQEMTHGHHHGHTHGHHQMVNTEIRSINQKGSTQARDSCNLVFYKSKLVIRFYYY